MPAFCPFVKEEHLPEGRKPASACAACPQLLNRKKKCCKKFKKGKRCKKCPAQRG